MGSYSKDNTLNAKCVDVERSFPSLDDVTELVSRLLLLAYRVFNLYRRPSSVFIYSMPGYSCSIRERMLYSSCKSSVIDVIENQCQLNITKKVSHRYPGTQRLSPGWLCPTDTQRMMADV